MAIVTVVMAPALVLHSITCTRTRLIAEESPPELLKPPPVWEQLPGLRELFVGWHFLAAEEEEGFPRARHFYGGVV